MIKLQLKQNMIITANMSNGTIQAALEPLARIERIENIYFLRKEIGPSIKKVKYILLPRLCQISIFNLVLTPLLLTYYSIKLKVSSIFSYHVIPYAFIAAIASFLTRKPYYVCQTGLLVQKKTNNKMFWFVLKRLLLNSQTFCVPGKSSYEFWLKKGLPSSKVVILHATVDTEKYKPDQTIKKVYDFIYVGRIAPEKRVDYLLNAYKIVNKKYPNSKLAIVGDGSLMNNTKILAEKLNLMDSVYFAGYQQNVLPWLHKSKSIVITSNTEGLPVAILEGMSVGLIPIATNVGNMADAIIDDETGYLINDIEDYQLFASKMEMLMKKPECEIDIIRTNARNIIFKNHSHSSSIVKWELIIN